MNLKQLLSRTASKFPANTAIISGNQRITYRELDEASNRIANFLTGLGIKRGDRVAMLLANCPEFAYFYFGIAKCGAAPVPLDTRYKSGEIQSIFASCTPEILVSDTPLLEPLLASLPGLPTLRHIISISSEHEDRFLTYPQCVRGSSATDHALEPSPRDLGLISYTSGPSIHPKGSAINHENLCRLADASGNSFEQTAEDRVMMFALPMYHNFSLGSLLLTSISLGSTLVLVPGTGMSISSLMETVDKERGTIWVGVPYIFALAVKIARDEGVKHDLSSLRLCVSGGAPLPVETIEQFREHYGLTICDAWGLTEAVSHVTCQPVSGLKKLGSCGKALSGYELNIVDDYDKELPAGVSGEVLVKGPMIDCYYNNPEATAKTKDNGWLHTGDLGYLDEDGYLFLTGRKKNMIIFKGQNVYPVDIEETLLTHPRVAGARVTGVQDRLRGEIVHARVKLKKGETVTEQEIKHFCMERLADYKAPREIEFVESL